VQRRRIPLDISSIKDNYWVLAGGVAASVQDKARRHVSFSHTMKTSGKRFHCGRSLKRSASLSRMLAALLFIIL
jgi:hypothetical protein